LTDFQKNTQTSNVMNICPVVAGAVPVDGQTDMSKVTATFLELCERS